MKSFKLRILSLTMAFAVLFSSTGFGMYVHTCKITQKKTFTLSSVDTCCEVSSSETGVTSFTKYKCCSIVKSLTKVAANQSHFSELSFNAVLMILPKQFQYFYFSEVCLVQEIPINLFANPPPVSGKLFLAFIQSYLI